MGKFLSSLYKSHDICVSVGVTSERNITRRCPEITHIVTSRIKRITNSRTEPLARNRKLIQTSDVVHTALQLTTTHYTNSTASFPGQPGYGRYQEGKTSLDLNEARDDGVLGMQWHQLDHMQTTCTSLQTGNHTNTSSLNFYRPDGSS